MTVAKGESLRAKNTADCGPVVRGTALSALAVAAVALSGCGIVPGVGNSDLPVGTPFEADTTAECFPPGGDPERRIWRTGQIEFVPIRRDRDGRFFIPQERKDQLIEVCFQSSAHLVVYLVPENKARRDAWINSVEIVGASGDEPPAGEFTTDDPGLNARKVLDVGRRGAAPTGCPIGEPVVGQRRHVVVFDRNTKEGEYQLRICIEDSDGGLHLLDPRIRNGGRMD